jgi:hypothetical protein
MRISGYPLSAIGFKNDCGQRPISGQFQDQPSQHPLYLGGVSGQTLVFARVQVTIRAPPRWSLIAES